MPLREPCTIPPVLDLCRFLASSITFMVHLKEIRLYLDDKCLSKLTKSADPPIALAAPNGLNHSSPERIMRIDGLESTAVHIKAEVTRWVYEPGGETPPSPAVLPLSTNVTQFDQPPSSSGTTSGRIPLPPTAPSHQSPMPPKQTRIQSTDLLSVSESNLTLSIFSTSVDVTLGNKLAAELHRCMKKNAPSRMRYDLIYVSLLCSLAPYRILILEQHRQERKNSIEVLKRRRGSLMS